MMNPVKFLYICKIEESVQRALAAAQVAPVVVPAVPEAVPENEDPNFLPGVAACFQDQHNQLRLRLSDFTTPKTAIESVSSHVEDLGKL